MTAGFNGPLFIVGMPRSGTKLLRSLLNQSPNVHINTTETDFLPYWINRWPTYGDLSNYANFKRFYSKALRLNYLKAMRLHDNLIDCLEWYNSCDNYSLREVFEVLIRHDIGVTKDVRTIWGDKTPSYITKTTMIKTVYPEAKFVHIIRDVRDYCLSLNKAFYKNMIRASQRWVDYINIAQSAGQKHGDYLEIKYEDILDDTEQEIKKICDFLHIPFTKNMTKLTRPAEKVGDAKGTDIMKGNKNKYITKMDIVTRRKVESIAGPLLKQLGYATDYIGPARRINPVYNLLCNISDGYKLIKNKKIKSIEDYVVNANRQ